LKDILRNESEIDLLKMDIEGAEVTVLEDCNDELEKIKNIYVISFLKNQAATT